MSITKFSSRSIHSTLSSWILVCGLLILSLTTQASAAYIQYQDCYDQLDANDVSQLSRFHPGSLRTALDSEDGLSVLTFNITDQYNGNWTCAELVDNKATVHVKLTTLAGSESHAIRLEKDACMSRQRTFKNTTISMTQFSVQHEIKHPGPLASYDVRIHLNGADGKTFGCLDAFLTPSIDTTTIQIAQWCPVSILVLVVLCAVWREISNLTQVQPDDETARETFPQAASQESSRAYLTRIADCLAYIQFIFFTGALSLNYPGFLQPMVSPSSWSTLMFSKGPVMTHAHYPGISDGVYELNGTFGGTAGLERMTQIMGAPATTETWTNVISLAFIFFIGLALVVQVGTKLSWSRDWFRSTNSWTVEGTRAHGQKDTAWVVVQVFVSYFLLPIVAWTTYQLDHVMSLPIYYTTAVTMVVCLLIGGCCWAMAERSPKNMGYLLIDGFEKRERPVSSRTQDLYTVITFVLIFLRAVAIGGLQVVGAVQLLVLIGCEIIQLALSAWTRPNASWITRSNLLTCARLTVLLLFSGMLPDLANFTTRNALGYIALVLHAVILLGIFLGPTVHESVQLSKVSYQTRMAGDQSGHENQPQVFGLRQLSRRPNAMTNLSTNALPQFDRASTPTSSLAPSGTSSPTPGSSLDYEPQSRNTSRTFFRVPKSPGSSADLSIGYQNSSVLDIPYSQYTPDTSSEGSSENMSPVLGVPSPAEAGIDYSFREADLYYGRPRRVSFGQAPAAGAPAQPKLPKLVGKASGTFKRLFKTNQ